MHSSSWTGKLLDSMIRADREGVAHLIDGAFAAGFSSERILQEILDPVLLDLGKMWEREAVSLSQTFVAAKSAEDILLRCLPEASSGVNPRKGTIVLGNIEDDFHSLGRRIVSSFLRASGWNIHDLGNDVPAEQFIDKALEVDATVIGVSAMMQTTALNIRKVRDLIDTRGLKGRLRLAVGGAVFNWRPELVAEVGADGTSLSAAHADVLFQRLQAEVGKGGSA